MDYAYNNPVIHVFIKVLKESLYDNPSILMESVVNGEKEKSLEKNIQTSSEFDGFSLIENFHLSQGFI